jgi:hypothetical protein
VDEMIDIDKKISSPKQIIQAIFISILLIVFIKFLCFPNVKQNTSIDNKQIDAFVYAQEFVKARLMSPSTAKFPRYDTQYVKYLGDGKYIVSAYVDAHNVYGAQIRNKFTCIIKYNVGTENWKLEEINIK